MCHTLAKCKTPLINKTQLFFATHITTAENEQLCTLTAMHAHLALHASVDEKPIATVLFEEPSSQAARLRVSSPSFYRRLVFKEELVVVICLAPPDTVRLPISVAHPLLTLRDRV